MKVKQNIDLINKQIDAQVIQNKAWDNPSDPDTRTRYWNKIDREYEAELKRDAKRKFPRM